MRCPKCQRELPVRILDPECEFERCRCGCPITIKVLRYRVEPCNCLLVMEREISPEEFNADFCDDCHANCILANRESDIDLIQDEENNWEYLDEKTEYNI